MYQYISDLYNYILEYVYSDSDKTTPNQNIKLDNPNSFYYLSLFNTTGDISNTHFTIHGLWPQFNQTTYPTYCKTITFNVDELKPIIDDLNKYWYSSQEKNSDFWEHEYKKHGTCMFDQMNELQYFQKALDLYYQATSLQLPIKYYNPDTHLCLIPVSLDFKFIQSSDVNIIV